MKTKIRAAVIGIDHNHINGMIAGMRRADAEIVAWCTGHDTQPDQRQRFEQAYPDLPERDRTAILEDPSVDLILTAAIANERAEIATSAMRHGKDVLVDKPGCTTFDQLAELRRVSKETGQFWFVYFSERINVESATLASTMVAEGRIGKVVQTIGLGPHRLGPATRAPWLWDNMRAGGILVDIAAHQFDQFLHFTGSQKAEVVTAHIGNVANPETPSFQDFGEVVLAGDEGRGYARVDWLTPDGLPTWGDGRMTIMGTEGYIELRKYVDIAGRDGKDHLFLVDGKGMTYVDATGSGTPFFELFANDIRERTETAMTQSHAFQATELALQAQELAESATGTPSTTGAA